MPYEKKEQNYSFAVDFRIIGDFLIPQEITKLLRLAPNDSHKKGDVNSRLTKKGKVIYYAPFNTGLWSLKSNLDKSSSIEEHLLSILEILEPVKNKIKELSNRGYKIDFYCGYFFSSEMQAGFQINSHILDRISNLGADINICMYVQN